MRAAQLTGIRQPLELVDLPDPVVPEGGVVLRVLACGVCRSDWHVWSGGDAVDLNPMIARRVPLSMATEELAAFDGPAAPGVAVITDFTS